MNGGLKVDTTSQRKQFGVLSIKIGIKEFKSEAASKANIYDGSLNIAILSQSTFIINFPTKQVLQY